LLRLALGAEFPPVILEVPDQFLLLRVHRNHGMVTRQTPLDLRIQMLELSVTVRVAVPLPGLAVGLQTVAELM
jgi:hypothetical protein